MPVAEASELLEDSLLVSKAAAGDELAFELLVRRHTEAVWRLSRSMLLDDFTAQEAVQDTFLKAYRALSSFRHQSSVKTWLHAICHRTCLDRLRPKRAQVIPLEAIREARAKEEAPELRLLLEDALRQLGQEEREAFVLVHVLSYSREEAAGICDVPASTMRSRVTRARQRLAALVRETEDAELRVG